MDVVRGFIPLDARHSSRREFRGPEVEILGSDAVAVEAAGDAASPEGGKDEGSQHGRTKAAANAISPSNV